MKAALLLAAWLAVGLYIATRGGRRACGGGAMVLLFWPFFLGQRPAMMPMDRLRGALAPFDPALPLVAELDTAVRRLSARLARVEAALAEAESGPSRALLAEAQQRLAADLAATLAAVDEAAARLTVLQDEGERAEVESALRALQGRLAAGEELGQARLGC